MIIIAGHLRTAPELVDEFADLLRSFVPATLREDGCHDYAFAVDDRAAGTVLVYERWRDQAALDAHLAQLSVGGALSGWSDRMTIEVRKFDAANERDFTE